VKDSRGLIMH